MFTAMETLEARVIRLVSEETGCPAESLSLEQPLDGLTADSIRLFMLVTRFEKEFDFQVTYEELMGIVTIGDIVRFLRERRFGSGDLVSG